jgi:hypothetical protein
MPMQHLVWNRVEFDAMLKSCCLRLVRALVALFGMLFMQLAVAGYLCPKSEQAPAEMAMAMPMTPDAQNMPGCDQLDPVQPILCHAQAHASQQSLDKPPLPDVQPFIPGALALVIQSFEPAYGAPVRPLLNTFLAHPTAPPLSIRNCCFRI